VTEDGRIPYLTVGGRAELFGLSYGEQFELEQREPWLRRWPARFEDGAERLRTWLAAGRPRADRGALVIIGDPAIVEVARDVLATLPEPAARVIVDNTIVRCGRDHCDDIVEGAAGWRRETLPGSEKPLEVGLLAADRDLVAHEFAHVWQVAPSPWTATLSAEQRESFKRAILADVVEEGTERELAEMQLQRERAADALASLWLGHRVDMTSGARGERRRQGLLRDIRNPQERNAIGMPQRSPEWQFLVDQLLDGLNRYLDDPEVQFARRMIDAMPTDDLAWLVSMPQWEAARHLRGIIAPHLGAG
jgi:hypothetical protein